MQDVGVIYLYRFAEGDSPVRRFLQTYGTHPAGMEHDLHVIFKGFPDRNSIARGRALFANIPINAVEQPDVGFDIGSYVEAANIVSNRRLLFLNTFSRILADDWLRHFNQALDNPAVGLAGATGSWQANTAPYEARLKLLLNQVMRLPGQSYPHAAGAADEDALAQLWQSRKPHFTRYVLAPIEYPLKLYQYGRHPNPHIRTNAFMMDKARFLSLDFPRFSNKNAVYKFESGRNSLTNQVLRQDLLPVVVDRNGRTYGVTEWKSSATFWIDGQANLNIADNRTTLYADGDETLRKQLENLAWVRPWDWFNRPLRRSSAT